MSRVAPAQDAASQRRSARRILVAGILACLPRLVAAFLVLPPAFDVVLILATLLFVAGLLVLALAIFRYAALRTPRVLPIGIAGAVAVVVAAVVVRVAPPGGAAVAYTGGVLAPFSAVAYQYAYLLLGALSQLGLMLVVGAVGLGISRRRSIR